MARLGPIAYALLAAPLALLTGCDRVETLAIDVHSEREVVLRLASARCIDALSIEAPDIKGKPVWQIERDPAQHAPCVHQVTFPVTPQGFRTPVTAEVLPKGSYGVSGKAQDYAIAGNFDVPTRRSVF